MKNKLTEKSLYISCLEPDKAAPCVVDLNVDTPAAVAFVLHPDSKVQNEKEFLLIALKSFTDAALCCMEQLESISPRFESEAYLDSATEAAQRRFCRDNSATLTKTHVIMTQSV